ncbi:MAG: bacteriohopanetetrol glucosamine biosynthesis glycosyltransferase HpnI [Vulcanimicrobiaceae bacterium]
MLVLCICGIVYLTLALYGVVRFDRRVVPPANSWPGVTILKPVHGLEAELFENLSSFCNQDYPRFQVIFGVQRHDDPALGIVRRVIDRFPDRDLLLVLGDSSFSGNPKVANLTAMMSKAKHDLVFVADADMRVDRRYLASVTAEFSDERVGAVTCLYAGVSQGGFASDLAALQLNDQFAPSVLVATLTRDPQFCFGSTMAVRREALEAIGGFAALAQHLADDYMLGSLVEALGYRVVLSRYVVRDVVNEASLAALAEHELRWARTIRSVRPLGYAFSFIAFPLPFALVFLAGSRGSATAWAMVAAIGALRIAIHYAVRRAFDRPRVPPVWLIPIRDCLGLAVWGAGLFGSTVRWQRHAIGIDEHGRISDSASRFRAG